MIRLPPRSTLPYTLLPSTTPFRSAGRSDRGRYPRAGVPAGLGGGAELHAAIHRPGSASGAAGPYSSVLVTGWCRSEEHTSELQSLMRISYAVFCLKNKVHKNNKRKRNYTEQQITQHNLRIKV